MTIVVMCIREDKMTKEQILKKMDEAFREDRDRFFRIADALSFQPKYSSHLEELEVLKQTWRDIPQQSGYPNFSHPISLPSWFPKVSFASRWEKDKYIEEGQKAAVIAIAKSR